MNNNRVLSINDVHASVDPMIYSCYGLGSCIGIFMIDRQLKISGGAHVPLPFAIPGSDFSHACELIDRLIGLFRGRGSSLVGLRAKITGGASMFENTPDIGKQNATVITAQLIANRIFIAASDVGGHLSRTAHFNSVTGDLHITTSEQKTYCI